MSSPRRSSTASSPAPSGSVYGNVRNDGLIDNLPARRLRRGRVPGRRRSVCARSRTGRSRRRAPRLNQVQINVQRLAVEAAMTGDRDLVHAAVALDPLTGAVQTLPKIHEMVDRMLEAEARWLPQFTAPVDVG